MRAIEPGSVAASGTFSIGGELVVRRMGYGAMRLTGPYAWGPPPDHAGAMSVLRRAIELGIDFIDTAEAYGPEINERQIAEAIAPYPKGLVIGTKAGLYRTWSNAANRPLLGLDGRPERIRTAIEGSLKRLKRDVIDLYQLHRIDPAVPLEDSVGALADLKAEGKLRHIGLSEVSIAELERARAITPIATVQNRYNIVDRFHDDLLAHCEARGIGFIPWFPLLGTGEFDDEGSPLTAVAGRHGASSAQIALAWLLARAPVILLIPGTGSIAHLEENAAAGSIALSADDLTALDAMADFTAREEI